MKFARIFWMMLLALALTASAQASPIYFAQDDFILSFGTEGNPGSAGSSFRSWGTLAEWNDGNAISGFYVLTGTTSAGAQLVGNQYVTNYDVNSYLRIYSDPTHLDLLWEGRGNLSTTVNQNGSPFLAANFARPDYETQPVQFLSVGDGMYWQTGGSMDDPYLRVPWFGTYNWRYVDSDRDGLFNYQIGNAQGMVPEPATMLLLGTGLLGLGFFRRKKNTN